MQSSKVAITRTSRTVDGAHLESGSRNQFSVAISEEIEHTCFLHDAAELNGLAF